MQTPVAVVVAAAAEAALYFLQWPLLLLLLLCFLQVTPGCLGAETLATVVEVVQTSQGIHMEGTERKVKSDVIFCL